MKEFDKISFKYLSRSHNQFSYAFATLSSMLQFTNGLNVDPLKIEVLRRPAYYMAGTEEPDGRTWCYDIMNYILKRELPQRSTPTD